MRNHLIAFVALLSLVTWCGRSAYAEPNPSGNNASKTNAKDGAKPKPEEILRKMTDYIGGLPAYSFHIDSSVELKATGIDHKFATKMTVKFQKPNRLALRVEDGQAGVTVVSDGKVLTQYAPAVNRYSASEAPPTIAVFGNSDGFSPFAMMGVPPIPTSANEYKELIAEVKKSEYLGTEKVGNVDCHRCRFLQEKYDWDIWISTGDKPVVYRFVPDLSKRLANINGVPKDAKINYNIVISDWNTAPKFSDTDFAFTPPADAKKVDSLDEDEEESGPHPLLGQPAPTFTTEDVDGHPFDLQKHLGKDVILLDFWATWCGPCVEAMPIIDDVAKKFADKGLVFKAVNSGEDAQTIKEFLESSKLNPPVVLDTKGEIGPLYKVNGIPQSVLIGKDGKVQVVHIGFAPALKEILTKEIEDLIAGKDLAGPQLKAAEEARKNPEAAGKKAEPAPAPTKDESKAAEN